MLIQLNVLKTIRAGKIDLIYRKWKNPRIKKGTLLKTAVGLIEIKNLGKVTANQIKSKDAIRAGFDNRKDLLARLSEVGDGDVYKISVKYHSPDPRIRLRQNSKLPDADILVLQKRLDRLDRFSKKGNWTKRILKMIDDNPKLRATDLALRLGYSKDWLKPNIRKLKNLGLTISHEIGYSISPLGKTILKNKKE